METLPLAVISVTVILGDPVHPVAFPTVPSKDVAVKTPVTTAPSGNSGAPVPALFTYL